MKEFKLSEYMTNSLKSSFSNGTFGKERVDAYAMNYRLNKIISEEQLQSIIEHVNPVEDDEIEEDYSR